MFEIIGFTKFAKAGVDCMTTLVIQSAQNVACQNWFVNRFCVLIHDSFTDYNRPTTLKHARATF